MCLPVHGKIKVFALNCVRNYLDRIARYVLIERAERVFDFYPQGLICRQCIAVGRGQNVFAVYLNVKGLEVACKAARVIHDKTANGNKDQNQ